MACHFCFSSLLRFFALAVQALNQSSFEFEEATIPGIQAAFSDGRLTSVQLVKYYLDRISFLNPQLHAVIEVNPDALSDAARADKQRGTGGNRSALHGIPVLVKDNISTRDRLNTTSGSFALLGSVVPRDAGVIHRLRRAGAILLGKANMNEWDNFRSVNAPHGWSPRGGQCVNPYPGLKDPGVTSSGSAVAVAANLVSVALATDLDGAIGFPATMNSVVGIKPSAGITSRSGIVPISPRLDTVGAMARTVADAVALLDAIVGFDPFDAEATKAAEKFIPNGGFRVSLNADGLKGKRLGILRQTFDHYPQGSLNAKTFEAHFETMKLKGGTLIDITEIKNLETMLNASASGEVTPLLAEFKLSLKDYLKELDASPVRSLEDVISFNEQHPVEERMAEFGQRIFLASEKTSGIGEAEKAAIGRMAQLSEEGFAKPMGENNLDAFIYPENLAHSAIAIGGSPVVTVPAGYDASGTPFGISFAGLLGSDSRLYEIAFAFEQATKVRRPPPPPFGKK